MTECAAAGARVCLIVYAGYGRTHARLADPARFDAKLAEVAATRRD